MGGRNARRRPRTHVEAVEAVEALEDGRRTGTREFSWLPSTTLPPHWVAANIDRVVFDLEYAWERCTRVLQPHRNDLGGEDVGYCRERLPGITVDGLKWVH